MAIKDIKLGHLSALHLRHPATDKLLYNDDKTPMVIQLVGEHSEEYKAVTRRWQNEVLRKPNRKLTAEQVDERGIDLLVACTKGWKIQWDQDLLPFSAEAARDLYSDREHAWIKNQVEAHLYEASNFLGESSKG